MGIRYAKAQSAGFTTYGVPMHKQRYSPGVMRRGPRLFSFPGLERLETAGHTLQFGAVIERDGYCEPRAMDFSRNYIGRGGHSANAGPDFAPGGERVNCERRESPKVCDTVQPSKELRAWRLP